MRLVRAITVVILLVASLCSTGCLHTWTQTYQDYPPAAWDPTHSRPQGSPSDG
jgi:hypothetical protein